MPPTCKFSLHPCCGFDMITRDVNRVLMNKVRFHKRKQMMALTSTTLFAFRDWIMPFSGLLSDGRRLTGALSDSWRLVLMPIINTISQASWLSVSRQNGCMLCHWIQSFIPSLRMARLLPVMTYMVCLVPRTDLKDQLCSFCWPGMRSLFHALTWMTCFVCRTDHDLVHELCSS